jgi:hypothetical protein
MGEGWNERQWSSIENKYVNRKLQKGLILVEVSCSLLGISILPRSIFIHFY